MNAAKRLLNSIHQGFLCAVLLWCAPVCAQSGTRQAAPEAETPLEARIRLLTDSLEKTRAELSDSRTEIRELRATLGEVMKKMDGLETAGKGLPAQPAPADANAMTSESPARFSQDDWEILNARVEEQRQTKVESSSKFPLKLSGLALFNAFSTSGQVDNLDMPSAAIPKFPGASGGSTSASLRQSVLGLTGFGPEIMGARTVADLQLDFFGGLPATYGGAALGIGRLRLARIRLDWKNTSLAGGLDTPFFSPNSPTSYMSVAVPGLASAGNLWAWTPSIRVEQRFDTRAGILKAEAGLFDSTAEPNLSPSARYPSPGESSRHPAYAVRFSANRRTEDRPASIGVAGIYSPQRFYNGYKLAGWGSELDWKFPVLPRTELSGEFFTGKGLDGFGGAAYSYAEPSDYLQYITVSAPALAEISMLGSWAQVKVKVNARGEFNVAAGYGGRNSSALRQASVADPYLTTVPARNQMLFVNYIFRPRSDLIFSAEYRKLRTYDVTGPATAAGQFGLAAGFVF
jgi:hypothetical protein